MKDDALNGSTYKKYKREKRILEITAILKWYKEKHPNAFYEIKAYEEELRILKGCARVDQ